MSTAPASESAAGPALRERLQGWSRYLALVAEQLEALEKMDPPRLAELATRRTELLAELDGDDPGPLLREAVAELERNEQEIEILRAQWNTLESDAVRSARELRIALPVGGRYVELDLPPGRLDTLL